MTVELVTRILLRFTTVKNAVYHQYVILVKNRKIYQIVGQT